LNEIVVARRKGAPAERLNPIGYLQRRCCDANRLGRRSIPPDDDPGWQPLDSNSRVKFATILSRPELVAQRCTLVVLGGTQRHARHRDGSPQITG
jgi:hypothetical protein